MSEKNLVLCVLLEKGSIFIFAGNTVIQGFKRLGSSEYVLKYIAVVFLSEMGGGGLNKMDGSPGKGTLCFPTSSNDRSDCLLWVSLHRTHNHVLLSGKMQD